LGSAAAVFYFAPNIIPDSIPFLQPSKKQETIDPGVARLSFKAVSGSFIQSHKAGQLFVIKGMVTNNYPKPRSFILVKGTILDDKGTVVKINMAYGGNSFAEKQIKEKPIEELNKGLKIRKCTARRHNPLHDNPRQTAGKCKRVHRGGGQLISRKVIFVINAIKKEG
jgi:hypothetical protein